MGSLQEELDAAVSAVEEEVKARYMKANRQREEWRRQMRRALIGIALFAIIFVAAYIASQ